VGGKFGERRGKKKLDGEPATLAKADNVPNQGSEKKEPRQGHEMELHSIALDFWINGGGKIRSHVV